jgi:hypothetical protein
MFPPVKFGGEEQTYWSSVCNHCRKPFIFRSVLTSLVMGIGDRFRSFDATNYRAICPVCSAFGDDEGDVVMLFRRAEASMSDD